MILSAQTIEELKLITPCNKATKDTIGNSIGLSACGYDLSLSDTTLIKHGEFKLAGASEYFSIPDNVAGIVHDKSSLARRGLAVQNTILEPGWRGYLTLELTNHGLSDIVIPGGCAIAQVVFHFLDKPTCLPYNGKYQDQKLGPVEAI